ncbi:MAG: hypothetical protein QW327_05810 [Candidatus Odinarchaeota archaeon]
MGSSRELEKTKSKKEELMETIDKLKEDLTSDMIQTKESVLKPRMINLKEIEEIKEEPLSRQIPSEGFDWAVNREKYPWMYWIPSKNEDVESWLNEWSDFTLQWFKANKIHIIPFAELMGERPFIYLQNKIDSLKLIIEKLISRKFCSYTGEDGRSIRVFWRGYEDWGDLIYNWALKNGMVDFTLFDIIDLEESTDNFHRLPQEDLKKIFSLLVKNKRAVWISKKNAHIKILF